VAAAENRLAVSEKQVLTLEKGLALTQQHADNLEKVVTDAKGRLKRTEERHAISEKLLASARHQMNAMDAELRLTRQHHEALDAELRLTRQHHEALEAEVRLTRQHAGNLEKLRDSLQRRVGELDEHAASLLQIRNDRDAKIRTMQRSFSWQVTAPLRWLRRAVIDPWRKRPKDVAAPAGAGAVTLPGQPPSAPGQPAAAAVAKSATGISIWHSVDYPRSWSLPPRKTTLRGWCFADDGRKLQTVRAVLPGRIVEGIYGFKRLDVVAAVRNKPQAEYCGWKIELEFAPTDLRLDLEAADESGTWHRFFHTALRIGEGFGPLDLTSYEKWVETYDSPAPAALRSQREQAAALTRQPVISVVMPVYNTPERWLRCAIESVRNQSYPHWELCIADDASPEAHLRPLLQDYARADPRIKVSFREKNGHISASSNSALELATGEFVALLDHDDELAPNALFDVAVALNARPATDYLYSDEDKIDEEGRRFEPYFKPDFLPDLFHSQNYTSHLSVYRTTLLRQVGGFRVGYEGSQDWDLALRAIEQSHPDRIVHLPKVLYHWRAIPGSTALLLSEKKLPGRGRPPCADRSLLARGPAGGIAHGARRPLAGEISRALPRAARLAGHPNPQQPEAHPHLRRKHPAQDLLPEFRDHHCRQPLGRSRHPRVVSRDRRAGPDGAALSAPV